MMRAPSRSSGRARWMMNNGARTLTANIRSNSFGVACSMNAAARVAALLTRMSSRCPDRPASSPANSVSTSPSTPSSARTGNAMPPSAWIAATVSVAAAWLLP